VSDISEGRFDTGIQWIWRPAGIFHLGQNVAASQATIVTVALSTFGTWVRVDWASVNIDFSVLDVTAMAQLVIDFDDETYVPFLSVSAWIDSNIDIEVAGVGVSTPVYPLSRTKQTSLPFVLGRPVHIALRGQHGGLGDSTIAGTVALSTSLGIPPN
jgi:hypothetical protein